MVETSEANSAARNVTVSLGSANPMSRERQRMTYNIFSPHLLQQHKMEAYLVYAKCLPVKTSSYSSRSSSIAECRTRPRATSNGFRLRGSYSAASTFSNRSAPSKSASASIRSGPSGSLPTGRREASATDTVSHYNPHTSSSPAQTVRAYGQRRAVKVQRDVPDADRRRKLRQDRH